MKSLVVFLALATSLLPLTSCSSGSIIWCGGFTKRESAQAALDTGLVDLIAFGRPYIANLDLAERLKHDWPLAEADRSTYYTRRGEVGYTDFRAYPSGSAAGGASSRHAPEISLLI